MDRKSDTAEDHLVIEMIEFCVKKAEEQKLPYAHFFFQNMSSHIVSELDASKKKDDSSHAKFVYVMQ